MGDNRRKMVRYCHDCGSKESTVIHIECCLDDEIRCTPCKTKRWPQCGNVGIPVAPSIPGASSTPDQVTRNGNGTYNDPPIVVNELLCFVVNKMMTLSQDTIVQLCINTFDLEEIRTAKDVIYTVLENPGRKIKYTTDDKGKKNIIDIMKLLNERGVNIPTFVAKDLSKLPPITFDSIDVSALLAKIQNTQVELDMLKTGMSAINSTNDSLRVVTQNLQSRVAKIEDGSNNTVDNTGVKSTAAVAATSALSTIDENTYVKTFADIVGDKTNAMSPHMQSEWTRVTKQKASDKKAANNTPKDPLPVQANTMRQKRNTGVVGTAATTPATGIRTVRTKVANVFATRFSPDLESKTLEDYLKEKLKMAIKCCKIETNHGRFASFHVTAECDDPKVFLEPAIWPEGAYVRWYYEPRKRTRPAVLQSESTTQNAPQTSLRH